MMHTTAPPVTAIIMLLGMWYCIKAHLHIDDFLLPSPVAVAEALWKQHDLLLQASFATLRVSVLGFIVGCIVAFVLALLFELSIIIKRALYPQAIAVKAIPIVAVAPILAIWFYGERANIVLAATVTFFPVLVAAVDGMNSVPTNAMDLMRSLSATRLQILLRLKIPNTVLAAFSGMKVASTLAVVGAIVAEFANATNGIGTQIRQAQYGTEMDRQLAAVVCAGVIGVLMFGAIAFLEKIARGWYYQRIEE
jgi:NitT/TauT family transport system permease protein